MCCHHVYVMLLCIMSESPLSSVSKGRRYEVVGTRPIRHAGVEKVTGQAAMRSTSGCRVMLYGKVLRSLHAHAWIGSARLRHQSLSRTP